MNKHSGHWETCVTCRSLLAGGVHRHLVVHMHWNFRPKRLAGLRRI